MYYVSIWEFKYIQPDLVNLGLKISANDLTTLLEKIMEAHVLKADNTFLFRCQNSNTKLKIFQNKKNLRNYKHGSCTKGLFINNHLAPEQQVLRRACSSARSKLVSQYPNGKVTQREMKDGNFELKLSLVGQADKVFKFPGDEDHFKD